MLKTIGFTKFHLRDGRLNVGIETSSEDSPYIAYAVNEGNVRNSNSSSLDLPVDMGQSYYFNIRGDDNSNKLSYCAIYTSNTSKFLMVHIIHSYNI